MLATRALVEYNSISTLTKLYMLGAKAHFATRWHESLGEREVAVRYAIAIKLGQPASSLE